MEKEIEHIMHSTQKESLTSQERDILRGKVLSFMKENPIPTREAQPVLSFYTMELFIRRHSALAAFALVFFLSGTTSAFADKALPGDTLYPLKTSVNEKVLGWFATSPESRAEWQLSLADRRLQEMQELSKSEKITADIRIELEKKIDTYTEIALGENPDSLLGVSSDSATAPEVASEKSAPAQSAMMMSVSAEVAPSTAKLQAEIAPSGEFDTESLKTKIAENRDSIIKQKSELKSEHLFVKRKAAVVWAEKLTLQADRLRAQGEHEAADELSRKAEDIISRIEPLSSKVETEEVPSQKEEDESDGDNPVSQATSAPTSEKVEVEVEATLPVKVFGR